jgi:hypothetical protein
MLIKLTEAFDHLRLPSDYPPSQVLPYLLAAEAASQNFCQRNFYASEADLTAAHAAHPVKVREAHEAYAAAVLAANDIEDMTEQAAAITLACRVRDVALQSCNQVLWGMVAPDDVKAAILLQLDHLFENRSENITGSIVTELKMGASSLLWPYRVRIGV